MSCHVMSRLVLSCHIMSQYCKIRKPLMCRNEFRHQRIWSCETYHVPCGITRSPYIHYLGCLLFFAPLRDNILVILMLQLGFQKFIAYTMMMIAIMKHANPNPNPISYPNPNITHNCKSEPYNLFLNNKNPIGQHCFKSALVQAETKNKQQDTKATTRHVHPRAAHSACRGRFWVSFGFILR